MAEMADATMTNADWRAFSTREQVADALARDVAEALRSAIADRGAAVLAVSGGSTPGLFFDTLAGQPLEWAKIVVTLVDERFVPPSSDRSNEKLVRQRLLVGEAAAATFVPLWSDAPDVDDAAARADAVLRLCFAAPDALVLGMGTDAHTASFFPDADDLDALTDPAQPRRVMPVRTAAGGEPRLTLTMPQIANAGFLALHIEGDEKRAVLADALAGAAHSRAPIARVFDTARQIKVYWAP